MLLAASFIYFVFHFPHSSIKPENKMSFILPSQKVEIKSHTVQNMVLVQFEFDASSI